MVRGRRNRGEGARGRVFLHLGCECRTCDGSDGLGCIVGEVELVVVGESLQLEEGLIREKVVGWYRGVMDGGHVNVVED